MSVNEIYQDIAQRIVDSIQEEWQSAKLFVDRQEKYVSVHGTYTNGVEAEKTLDDSQFGYLFSLKIHELHSITTQDGINKWNKLSFALNSENKFEMNFIWDQEYQDEIDRLNKLK